MINKLLIAMNRIVAEVNSNPCASDFELGQRQTAKDVIELINKDNQAFKKPVDCCLKFPPESCEKCVIKEANCNYMENKKSK